MKGLVDVHHHVVPDFYVQAHKEASISKVHGLRFPRWSPKISLAMMNSLGIEKAYLSYSTPGVDRVSDPVAFARRCNEYLAEVRSGNPSRFGAFGALPLASPDAALEELKYALGELRLDGIALLSNTNGTYLGDAGYDDLYRTLDALRATVFIHPTDPADDGYDGLVNVFYGWFVDTARTVVLMSQAEVFERFPNITFILAHGGGALPAIADVIARDGSGSRRLHCDTAKVAEPGPLATLEEAYGSDRVLFGSDFPWGDARKAKHWIRRINDRWADDPDTLDKLVRGNADLILRTNAEEVLA